MTKFADRLDVGGERKRGLRVIARSLTRVAERMNTSAGNRDVRRLRRSIRSVGVGLKSRDKVCEGQMTHSVDHREKTFSRNIFNKELIFRIHKELSKHDSKITKSSTRKWAKTRTDVSPNGGK